MVEGICQARVAEILKRKRWTVFEHAEALERGGYVERIPGTRNPVIYEKGPNGILLDKLAMNIDAKNDGTGVVKLAYNVSKVPHALVHHRMLRTTVLRYGDISSIRTKEGTFPFLKKYQDNYHGADRYSGKIRVDGEEVTVVFELTAKHQYLYLYLPMSRLTERELPQYKVRAEKEFKRALDFIQKYARWEFEGIEWTRSKIHIAVVFDSLMKGRAEVFDLSIPEQGVWSSNSDGNPEIETSEVEIGIALLTMPQRLIEAEREMAGLRREVSALRSEVDSLQGASA